MENKTYVVKFGEMYLSNQGIESFIASKSTIMIYLTSDSYNAKRYEKSDIKGFQKMMALGANIVEINSYEIDKTYSIEQEIKADDATVQDDVE